MVFILFDIVCENTLSTAYETHGYWVSLTFITVFVISQILFAPIQAGISDVKTRKKGITFALAMSILSIAPLPWLPNNLWIAVSMLTFATICKGMVGNGLPLSLASISDTHREDMRIAFGLSSGTYAVAYLLLLMASLIYSSTILITPGFIIPLGLVGIALIILCKNYFYDREDYTIESSKDAQSLHLKEKKPSLWDITLVEFSGICADLKDKTIRKRLFVFFLWEVSIYVVLLSEVDFKSTPLSIVAIVMMLGYICGVGGLYLCRKISDKNAVLIGYILSGLSFLFYVLVWIAFGYSKISLAISFFVHTFGNAFLSAALMNIFAKERSSHQQGKIFGLMDSYDSLAFGVSYGIIHLFNHFNISQTKLFFISFVAFFISIYYYLCSKETKLS